MLLSEAFNLYRRELRLKGHSPRTEDGYKDAYKSLTTFFEGDIDVAELTYESVRDYIDWLNSKNLSPGCVSLYLNKLRVVLRHLQLMGFDCLDPSNIPLPKKQRKIPQFLTPMEVELLISVASKTRNKALISLLYSTGLRVCELLKLDRSDIKEGYLNVITAKNGDIRQCFLDKRTQRLIGAYLRSRTDNDPALFYSNVKRCRMQHQNVEFMFRRWRKLAGFTWPVHAHSLRHSFASDLNMNGMDIYSISKLLGHRSISSTEIYLHIFDGHLEERYKKYHKV